MRQILATVVLLAIATWATRGWTEAEPLLEEPTERESRWTLSLVGGGAFPLGRFESSHELGLAARLSLAFTSKLGLGAAVSVAYSPLPSANLEANVRRENHVGSAAIAPRMTIGRGTVRLFVGGGGGVFYERSSTVTDGQPAETSARTEPAAVAEAGVQLHFAEAGGLTIGGAYLYSVGETKAQLAAAQAGFVLSF